MASSTPTVTLPAKPERIDLEASLPTSPADVAVLRALRSAPPSGDLATRLANASATRLFPWLEQRRTTSEGWEPFTLE
jgi:hypothetical protein